MFNNLTEVADLDGSLLSVLEAIAQILAEMYS